MQINTENGKVFRSQQLLPIIGQKRIIHHFSKQHTICEKFDCSYTLRCQNKNVFGT